MSLKGFASPPGEETQVGVAAMTKAAVCAEPAVNCAGLVGSPAAEERRYFYVYEFQRHFRKYYQNSMLAVLRKRIVKCVIRNDSGDPLCSPKAPQGTGKRILYFCHFPLLPHSVHTRCSQS